MLRAAVVLGCAYFALKRMRQTRRSQPSLLADINKLLTKYSDLEVLTRDLDVQHHLWNKLLGSTSGVFTAQGSRPCVWATCKTKEQVVACLELAHKHKLKVSCKGSGHNWAGLALVPGCLVVDMSRMTTMKVEAAKLSATIQPGVKAKDFRAVTISHGLHFPGPHLTHVGLSGFVLGGGQGWGWEHYGMACDSLVSATVILMGNDGPQEVQVDDSSHPDLMRGLRGGAFFLGVVVEMTLRLYPSPRQLYSAVAIYPLDCAAQVFQYFKSERMGGAVPSYVESAFWFAHSDPEGASPDPVVGVTSLVFQEDRQLCEKLEQQLDALLPGRQLVKVCGFKDYEVALQVQDPFYPPHDAACYGEMLLFNDTSKLDADVVALLANSFASNTAQRSVVYCGVSPAKPANCNSVYSFYGAAYVGIDTMWKHVPDAGAADRERRHASWCAALREKLEPRADGFYLNQCMLVKKGDLRRCFSADNWSRLKALKEKYDPTGAMRKLE